MLGQLADKIQSEDRCLCSVEQDVKADEAQEKIPIYYIDTRYRHTIIILIWQQSVNTFYIRSGHAHINSISYKMKSNRT